MESWIGETENRIKACEVGFSANIKRQREDLAYRKKLESHLINIFNYYTEEGIKDQCSSALTDAWNLGKALTEVPDPNV